MGCATGKGNISHGVTSAVEVEKKAFDDYELIEEETVQLANLSINREYQNNPSYMSRLTCDADVEKESQRDINPLVNIGFLESDLRESLVELSMMTQIPIVLDDTVDGIVTANFIDVAFIDALEIILAAGNYSYRLIDGYVLVGSGNPDDPIFSRLSYTCRYKPGNAKPLEIVNSFTPYYRQFISYSEGYDYISITAPHNVQKEISKSLNVFDKKADQILLELSVIEVSRSALDIIGLGVDQFGRDPNTLRSRRFGIGEWDGVKAKTADDAGSSLVIGKLPSRRVAEALQLMEKDGKANLKAMPSIVSEDGKEAHFSSMQTIWLPELSSSTGNTKVRELSYGIDMKITPKVLHDGSVGLNIANASVSDLSQSEQGYPIVISHDISNKVRINNGDYLVLGGLLQSKVRSTHNGVKGLKNIPLVGYMFGQETKQVEKMEVLVMLRPSILSR
jgi:type II secretory pathway component GspD/PulD (secretin)